MSNYILSIDPSGDGHYELDVAHATEGSTAKIQISVYVVDGPFPGNLTPDQIADAFRDWVTGLSGYGSSTLRRIELASTVL